MKNMKSEELQKWIDGMVERGTFETHEDAVEFCIGATWAFCKYYRIDSSMFEPPLKWEDFEELFGVWGEFDLSKITFSFNP